MLAPLRLRVGVLAALALAVVSSPIVAQQPDPLAEVSLIGAGTPGVNGVPQLHVLGLPAMDSPAPGLMIEGGPAFAPVHFLLGWPGGSIPVPAFGAELHPAGPLVGWAAQLDASGASAPVAFGPAPMPASMNGIALVVQGLVGDGAAQGGVAFTRGWRLDPGAGSTAASLLPWPTFRTSDRIKGRVAVGDLNGDGRKDIIAGTGWASPDTLSVFRQLADGTLAPPLVTSMNGVNTSVGIFADRDGDGILDYTASNSGAPGIVSRRGLGNGSFGPAQQKFTPTNATVYAVADLTGDGLADVFARWNQYSVVVLPGAPGLNLGTPVLTPLPNSQWLRNVTLGDIDGDGHLDVLSDSFAPTLSVMRGMGDGSFDVPTTIALPLDAVGAMAVGDLQGDGWLDVVVGGETLGGPLGELVTLVALSNDGAGSLAVTSSTAIPDYLPDFIGTDPRSVDLADVDNDGLLEVFVSGNSRLWMGESAADGSITDSDWIHVYGRLEAIEDIDDDGRLDLLVKTGPLYSYDRVAWYRGVGGGGFDVPATIPGFQVGLGNELVDLDGDGDLDAVGFYPYDPQGVLRVLGDGSGGFGSVLPVDLGGQPQDLAVGDLDGDGVVDLVATHMSSASPGLGVAHGVGDGSFAPAVGVSLPAQCDRLRLHDADLDGRLDVLVAEATSTGTLLWTLLGQPGGTFAAPLGTPTAGVSELTSFSLGDLDGDGIVDIVGQGDAGLTLLAGTGTALFGAPEIVPGGSGFSSGLYPVGVGDVDGDGDLDVIGQVGVEGMQIYTNDGAGGLTKQPNGEEAFSGSEPLFVDANLDGAVDVVGSNGLWLGTGGGAFAPWQEANLCGEASADLDGDGDIDFLIGGYVILNGLK
ncbi:MAG: hypothetical protein ACI9EF_000154 [Pseudohongiellaceae bacterium]|jgi:hypothetical protein